MDDGMTGVSPTQTASQTGSQRGAARIDPADRAQLAESPVSTRRVLTLFRPHWRAMSIVTAIIVATSIISMAQPFLVRAIIDDALPQQDVTLLAWLVGGMLAVAAATSLLGVVQTWMSTGVGQRVMHELRTSYKGANITAIDCDAGSSEVNQLNRLKLMLAVAKERGPQGDFVTYEPEAAAGRH